MKVRIRPGKATGVWIAPPSKSFAHRALICAALANGTSKITGVEPSQDVLATLDCIRALGAEVEMRGNTALVTGNVREPDCTFPCRESGSTLRFFLPLALLRDTPCTLTGSRRLLQRPLDVYRDICAEQGLRFARGEEEIEVKGRLQAGSFRLRGDLSSQFLSGLLFALPLLREDSRITILPPFVSAPYPEMTRQVQSEFGIRTDRPDPLVLKIPGNQTYTPADYKVEGDYSNAAFADALNLLGGRIAVPGLDPDSCQGDRIYKHYYEEIRSGNPTLDVENCPDLAPVLMALGAALGGVTLRGTARLADKESDRGRAMAEELAKFGIKTELQANRICVRAGDLHTPSEPLNGHNDHRIVMACATLLTVTGGEIRGAEAVGKSYPDYFTDLKKVGIEVQTDETDA